MRGSPRSYRGDVTVAYRLDYSNSAIRNSFPRNYPQLSQGCQELCFSAHQSGPVDLDAYLCQSRVLARNRRQCDGTRRSAALYPRPRGGGGDVWRELISADGSPSLRPRGPCSLLYSLDDRSTKNSSSMSSSNGLHFKCALVTGGGGGESGQARERFAVTSGESCLQVYGACFRPKHRSHARRSSVSIHALTHAHGTSRHRQGPLAMVNLRRQEGVITIPAMPFSRSGCPMLKPSYLAAFASGHNRRTN